MSEIQKAHGGFFVQTDEDELFFLLTCTGVGDVALPEGDESPVYCPSPSEVGKFIITDAIEGERGLVTYSLTRPLRQTLNYLLTELRNCRFHGRINWRLAGSTPDLFSNYLVGLHLHSSKVSNRTVTQPVVAPEGPSENDRVMTNADINAFDWEIIYPVRLTRITLTETEAINGLAFDLSLQCFSEEIGGDPKGKEGYFTTDFLAASATAVADFWYSKDEGDTWSDSATEPFIGGESQGAVATRGGRVIVARLTPDAGNPAEVAISDDYGATWSHVDVGSVNNQIITAMVWLDNTHLWAVATGGYVYFSGDRGDTWSAQSSGTLTTEDLRDVDAYDQSHVWASGDNGALLKTTDGSTWQTVTGPAAIADAFMTCFMRNSTRVFIASDAGVMYVTPDGGTTWTAKGTPTLSGGAWARVRFELEQRYHGFVVGNDGSGNGRVYRTEDGGASWEQVTYLANSGLNDLFVIDANHAWVAGEAHGGTAFLAKIQPVS